MKLIKWQWYPSFSFSARLDTTMIGGDVWGELWLFIGPFQMCFWGKPRKIEGHP